MKVAELSRRLSIGAEVLSQRGVYFRVWAPRCGKVEVVIERGPGLNRGVGEVELRPEADGYFSGVIEAASDGTLYRFRLDGGDQLFPDPASRFQPDGPHGPSQVIDAHQFQWTDQEWPGVI